jgi:hypothetical protein
VLARAAAMGPRTAKAAASELLALGSLGAHHSFMRARTDCEVARERSRLRGPPMTELVPPWLAVDWQVIVLLSTLILCFMTQMLKAGENALLLH